MTRYHGGTKVLGGYYWNISSWELVAVQGEVGTLRAASEETFLRLPLPVLLLVIPLMGALFAFFLPALGFAMVTWGLGKKLAQVGRQAMQQLAATVSPAWRPGEANFAGKPDETKEQGRSGEASLEKLKQDIEERRRLEAEKEKKDEQS